MIPVDQRVLVNEDGTGHGDCLRACIASIIGNPTTQVPDFAADGSYWNSGPNGAADWLKSMGWAWLRFDMDGCRSHYVSCLDHYCILGGRSPRGADGTPLYHSVVGRANGWSFTIDHDPHPSRAGLAGDPTSVIWLWRVKWPLTHDKFVNLIEPLRETAKSGGYCLAVHGSLGRDIDLVAVPWTKDAIAQSELAESIRRRAEEVNGFAAMTAAEGADKFHQEGCPGMKPHGRLVFSYHLGNGPYIDLAVMPRQGDWSL